MNNNTSCTQNNTSDTTKFTQQYLASVKKIIETPLSERIHPQWFEALKPIIPEIEKMEQFVLDEISQGYEILPEFKNILRAFTYPLNDVKVLIVGQDPYPTPHDAIGLSFSVSSNSRIPKSLRNIFKELEADLHTLPADSGDLTPWCNQGVCLLNRVLTVRAHNANSHANKGWEHITQFAIEVLNNRQNTQHSALPLVAILWGNKAQELEPYLSNAYIIKSAHPSPLSASRGFFNSQPFSNANKALATMNATPINWQLPSSCLL
ncbi:MAG: uracil-DNA glycosylase [Bifidobacteriaceae bacterium]|nr:uracil-DNA glycosylase [Bifidobacteriaceae bacterium]